MKFKELRETKGIPTKMINTKLTGMTSQLAERIEMLKDPLEIIESTQYYWSQRWGQVEKDRFSNESKRAYMELRKILKYHLFEKRDGSIINELIDDQGEVITNIKSVNEMLAKRLEKSR